jgi:hypothetical protein
MNEIDTNVLIRHRDNDGLNNQVHNFTVTQKTSKYKGVSFNKNTNTWQASARRGGVMLFRKYFKTQEEASVFYQENINKPPIPRRKPDLSWMTKEEKASHKKAYRDNYNEKYRVDKKEILKQKRDEKYFLQRLIKDEYKKERDIKKANDNKERESKNAEKKAWREANKDKIEERRKATQKAWREANKERLKEKSRNEYKKNKERIDARHEENRKKNKHKIYQRIQKRIDTDPVFKLNVRIRNLIATSIRKRCGFKKEARAIEILGCSLGHFKIYIESKFEHWMNWNNYGKFNGELNYGWDLDHIIPVATAETKEDIVKLNHYSNFQPLCSYFNRHIKRAKLINAI